MKENYTEIDASFNHNISRIRNLLDGNFIEEAIIITVTTVECLFEDLIKISNSVWFGVSSGSGGIGCLDNNKRVEVRGEVKHFLEKLSRYDVFLKQYYVFKDSTKEIDVEGYSIRGPELATIFYALFKNTSKINFQNLKENGGAKHAFKALLNIELIDSLDDDSKKSYEYWDKLIKFFEERHLLVHNGKQTNYSNVEVEEVITFLEYMEKRLITEIKAKY